MFDILYTQRLSVVVLAPKSVIGRGGHSDVLLQIYARFVIQIHVAHGHSPERHYKVYQKAFERRTDTLPSELLVYLEHAHITFGMSADKSGKPSAFYRAEYAFVAHQLGNGLHRIIAGIVIPVFYCLRKRGRKPFYFHAVRQIYSRRHRIGICVSFYRIRLEPYDFGCVYGRAQNTYQPVYPELSGKLRKIVYILDQTFISAVDADNDRTVVVYDIFTALEPYYLVQHCARYRILVVFRQFHTDSLHRYR